MDMNVSLTAVSLLWNASDLISKLHSKSSPDAAASSEPSDSSKPTGPAMYKIDAVQYEELIRQLFGALQVSPGNLSAEVALSTHRVLPIAVMLLVCKELTSLPVATQLHFCEEASTRIGNAALMPGDVLLI